MSFILDALRKSETERQKQSAPGLADGRYPVRSSGRNVWVPVLIAVTAANLILLGYLLWTRDATAPAPAAVPVPRSPPPVIAAPTPASPARPAAAERAPAAGAVAPPADPPARVAVVHPKESATAPEPKPSAPAALPTIQQLTTTGMLSLPPLHLDIHVYSEDPAQRFVFINMKKYREGEELREGPRVVEITPDGAVLDHRGDRFLLGRE